jgi:amidase
VALRELLVQGDVAPHELRDTARRALEKVNPDLGALTAEPFDPALDADPAGALAGVPLVIKDSAPFARGVPFTLGSRSIVGARAAEDHPFMRKIRRAGLVTIGQSTTPEWSFNFATESLRYGVTRNPWNVRRGAGGSSGGAAALVASGAVALAHGSDGAGSIRIPASCCGVVGLKPSRGRTTSSPAALSIPTPSGTHCAGESLAVDFALTRTVRDSARLLELMTEPAFGTRTDSQRHGPASYLYRHTDAGPALTSDRPLRVALSTSAWSGVAVNPEVAAAVIATGEMLEWIGHRVTPGGPTLVADDVTSAVTLGFLSAGQKILAAPVQPRRDLLETVSRSVLDATRALTGDETRRAVSAQMRLTRGVDAWFDTADLLVTPTLAQLPPDHGTLNYDAPRDRSGSPLDQVRAWANELFEVGPFTALFNVTGHPAISLPLGHSALGLPIGVQLVAGYGQDELLLAIAADLERAMPWHRRVPPIFAG